MQGLRLLLLLLLLLQGLLLLLLLLRLLQRLLLLLLLVLQVGSLTWTCGKLLRAEQLPFAATAEMPLRGHSSECCRLLLQCSCR